MAGIRWETAEGQGVERLFDRLENGLCGLLVALLAAMTALIGAQVFARYLFNHPLYWTEELGRHLMIWMVFMASVVCLRRGFHLNISFLEQRLRGRARMVLGLVMALLLGYFFYLMVTHGWDLTRKTMGQRSSALHYPMGLVYAAMPLSGLLMLLVDLEQVVAALVRYRSGAPEAAEGNQR